MLDQVVGKLDGNPHALRVANGVAENYPWLHFMAIRLADAIKVSL